MDIEEYRREITERLDERLSKGSPGNQLTRFASGRSDGAEALAAGLADPLARLMQLAADTGAPTERRRRALAELMAARFVANRFAPREEDFRELLRSLAMDPAPGVRLDALEAMAIEQDPQAFKLLRDQVEGETSRLIPMAKAVQLLAYDSHAEAAEAVKELLGRNSDQAVWDEGLRLLAGDPGATDLLVATLRNRRRASRLRRTSARALQVLDQGVFSEEAARIVLDEREDDDLRAVCLVLLGQSKVYEESRSKPVLREGVRKLASARRSSALKSAARTFLAETDGH